MTESIRRVTVHAMPYPGRVPRGVGRSIVTPLSGIEGTDGESAVGLRPFGYIAMVVRIEDAAGRSGVGTVGFGHPASLEFVRQFAPSLVGRHPSETKLLWETMYRSTLNVGRRGACLHAISGIDIALWDLLGRQLGEPVHALLGGAVRSRQPAYASALHPTEDLDALAATARSFVARGFGALKLWFAYGPRDGKDGIRKNVEMVETVTEAIGPDVDLMADAYMGWDLSFAIRCIRAIEDAGIRLRWLEEPLPPDAVPELADLRRRVDTPIASGEHLATAFEFRQLAEAGAVDVMQPDATRAGGITECRRIWALGEVFGLEVVAHLGYAANLHLSLASFASPYAEYLPPLADGGVPDEDQVFREIYAGEPLAVDGELPASTAAGLGLTLVEDGLERLFAFPA